MVVDARPKTNSELLEAIEKARAFIEWLHTDYRRLRREHADVQAENRALRLHVERLQGALRRAAQSLDGIAEEHSRDLDVRAAAIMHEANAPVGVLL